jgi:hypothetical protein
MEIPIHEYTYWDFDLERLWTSFRIIVREPGHCLFDSKYIYGGYFSDEDKRDEILDAFVELFVLYYDNGYTDIVDYFLPKDT